jgi:hypothetical protein
MSSVEISPELEDLIIRRLAETANRNKVIEELCLERGMAWGDAGQIVDHLIKFHNLEITRQQSPYLILAALSIFIGGILLVAWNLLGISNYFWPYFDPNTPDAMGLYLLYSDAFQTLLYFPHALPLFITGLAMIAGSYFGMKDIWASFFEWLDQQRTFSFSASIKQVVLSTVLEENQGPNKQAYDSAETPTDADFVPNKDALDYILDHLEKGRNEAELVEELWFKFGINKPQGYQMVRQVLSAQGRDGSGKTSMKLILFALAVFFTGLVWVFQFIFLLTEYLSGISRPLENAWHLILWLNDIGRYIEHFPGLFGLFILGLVFLVGGFYELKVLWALIFLLKRKPLLPVMRRKI